MSISHQAPQVPPSLYGAVAFQILNNLLVTLRDKGILTRDERAGLLNTVADGMQPLSDPAIKDMKDFLKALAAAG
jgi:hypothetical protein